ncbi:hypothetical protein EPO34_01305 [Patescibacteria group bacterium]|nr:MAG: hypothetical protein EPO34_01305 [Patescibacteria group bacterium]
MPTDQPDFTSFEPEPDEAGDPSAPALCAQGRTELAARILHQAHEAIGNALALLEGGDGALAHRHIASLVAGKRQAAEALQGGGQVVEGVFDGCAMVGNDGRSYRVPPNYASKSRLVEGDVLKLCIRADGAHLFKQISPVERRRVTGKVAFDPSTDSYLVSTPGAVYKVLTASITFYRAEPGDEAAVLVPKGAKSVWAAMENVMKS